MSASAVGCLQAWPDEDHCIYYGALTGDTHKLDAIAAALYDLLLEQPRSEFEILRSLEGVLEPDDEVTALQGLHDYLTQFTAIGLFRELPD